MHRLSGRLAYESRLIGKEDVPRFSLACLQGLRSGHIDDVWVWFYQNDHKEQLCTPQAITILKSMAKENNKKRIIENVTQSLINRVFVKSEQPNWDILKNFEDYLLATPL